MSDFKEEISKLAWETYKKAVGGKAFNGDPLPGWEEMVTDEQKVKIVEAWRATAEAVATKSFLEAAKELASDLDEYAEGLREGAKELEEEFARLCEAPIES